MIIDTHFKRAAAEVLWYCTAPSPTARRLGSRLGMRIHQEWLRSKTGIVELVDGSAARLSSLDSSYLAFELHWKGWRYFSPFAVLTFSELLPARGTFADVGANIGYYSLTAAALRPALTVVAFEPNPHNFQNLRRNSALNGSRVRCVQAALSDGTAESTLYMPRSAMSASLEPGFNERVEQRMKIRTLRFDDAVSEQGLEGPMVIKAIIEGHEPAFLRGAEATLSRLRPDMLLAVTRRYDDATLGKLRDLGYSFYQITQGGLIPEPNLSLCHDGPQFYLEHLVTTRSGVEVAGLSAKLRPAFAAIDPRKTNTFRPDLDDGRADLW